MISDLMGGLVLSLFTLISVILYFLLQNYVMNQFYGKEVAIFEKAHSKILEYPDCKYFTRGGRGVWSEITYSDLLKKIKNECRGYKGWPKKPSYLVSPNYDKKYLYIVFGFEYFDFSKLMHYDDWIKKYYSN